MKEFKVLPTNPDFQALTETQVGFIMGNMEKDIEIQNMLAKGQDPSKHIRDTDESWWDTPIEDFNPKGSLDISDEEIAAQLDALTSEEDKRRLASIAEGSKEWADYLAEEGNDIEQLSIEKTIQANIRKAQEDARKMMAVGEDNWGKASMSEEEEGKSTEFEPMTQEGVEEALRLFEGEELEEEEAQGPDDGWI